MNNNNFKFSGAGNITSGHNWKDLKPINLAPFDDPEGYQVLDADLVLAIDTALSLGMPLLLTGEPGVGKSCLASRIAAELNCECLVYRVKSSSEGTDALYQIDHLGRMADASSRTNSSSEIGRDWTDALDILRYIHFNALGKAVLRTWPAAILKEHGLFDKAWPATESAGKFTHGYGDSSPTVVLIDEIDKAPSDVPNDLLEEVRTLSFELPYLGDSLGKLGIGGPFGGAGDKVSPAINLRPMVIITSNSERSLPQAFLRRCAYFHMKFPEYPGIGVAADDAANIRYQHFQQAIQRRISRSLGYADTGFPEEILKIGWDYFWCLRNAKLERKPSTAELLNWMTRLCDSSMQSELAEKEKRISLACQLLVKQKEEVGRARESLLQLEN